MTQDELRDKYEGAKKIIRAEWAMRDRVFPEGHPKRAAKIKEMVELLRILAWMKDELKPHCEPAIEQGTLLDVPRKTTRREEFR